MNESKSSTSIRTGERAGRPSTWMFTRKWYISATGQVKRIIHVLIDEKLARKVDAIIEREGGRRRGKLGEIVEKALRLYVGIYEKLGREPTFEELEAIIEQFKVLRRMQEDLLKLAPLPELETDEEVTIVSNMFYRYMTMNVKWLTISNPYDYIELFNMPPEKASEALKRLVNKGIVKYYDKGHYIKIKLSEKYLNKLLQKLRNATPNYLVHPQHEFKTT